MKITLNEILEMNGKTVNDIKKIYHGKDNWCRCGCGGRYFRPEDSGFKRAINAMNKVDFETTEKTKLIDCGGVEFVNVPERYKDNKCYCIYFD